MKETALVLVSHGNMAIESLKSAEMIVGKVENIYALCLNNDEKPEKLGLKIHNLIRELHLYKSILIFVDVIGGTPFRVTLEECMDIENVRIVSGFNLGMIIEFTSIQDKDIDKIVENLLQVGRNQIIDIKAKVKKSGNS